MDLSVYLCQVLKGCIHREGQRMIGHIGFASILKAKKLRKKYFAKTRKRKPHLISVLDCDKD